VSTAARPLKNYARTQKHDPSATRTNENALTTNNSPKCQQPLSNSLENDAPMDTTPAATGPNNALNHNNINADTIGNDSTEEASMKIDAPLSPNSQQLLDSINSTINQENTFGSFEASDYALDFEEETSLELFTGIETPQDVEGNITSPDEGYSTSGSASGKSSPSGSFGDNQPSDNLEVLQTATDASVTVAEENIQNIFVQEANIDPILENLSSATDLFGNNNNKNLENMMVMNVDNQDGHLQTLDLGAIMQDSSNIQFVVVDNGDSPADAPAQEFTLIGTYDNYPEMIQANPSLSSEKEKDDETDSPKEPRRHTKGPKKADLSEIPVENRQNVIRCRKYRRNKNIKAASWEEELTSLEARNEELKEQEKVMMERLAKVQGAYINLIKAGRIKCV